MDEELELGAGLLGVELLLVPPADEPDVPPALEGGVLLLEELELGELLLGAALEPLEPLGEALGELLELELLGELLAPPEAEPDFDASLVPVEAEPDAEPLAPEGDDGDVLLGEEAELELDEPGLDALLEPPPPSPHAARPKTRATAPAITESFMCPPWLGRDTCASCEPDLTP